MEPELTTVRLPAEEVGAAGMHALMAALEGRPPAPVSLPVELVVPGLHRAGAVGVRPGPHNAARPGGSSRRGA
ncbi:hypothetical protein SRIMM317S_01456 [Streptomyces rimosus subsp. rimosus]